MILKFTHGVTKKEGHIVKEKICGWTESGTNAFTFILCDGGATFPVLEKPDEIKSIFEGVNKENGNKES